MKFQTNVIVIDDKHSEVEGIIEGYRNDGAGCLFYNAHLVDGDEHPDKPYSDVRIVFLDVYYTDNTTDYDPELCSGWIDSIVNKKSFYVLVIWSKDTDHTTEIMEELAKIEKTPFIVIERNKSKYIVEGVFDFEKLVNDINSQIGDVKVIEELEHWKESIILSSNIVLGHLSNNLDQSRLIKRLQKIIIGHGGKSISQSDDNHLKRESLYDAMDKVLISNSKSVRPIDEISQENIDNLYNIPENITADIDTVLNSWFHFNLYSSPLKQNRVIQGTLASYKSNFLESMFTIQNDDNIKSCFKIQIDASQDGDNNTSIQNVCLLLSRPCDIAQLKTGNNVKLLSGIMINNPQRKANLRKDIKTSTKFDSLLLLDHINITEECIDSCLVFDYRYAFSIPIDIYLNKFDFFKIVNKEILSEVQVSYSSYTSRLGITQII